MSLIDVERQEFAHGSNAPPPDGPNTSISFPVHATVMRSVGGGPPSRMRTHVPGAIGVAHAARAVARAARGRGHEPLFASFETRVVSEADVLASTADPIDPPSP
jgi:hypothetical protein